MKILVIHGPNLNMLGKRDPIKYGTVTMTDINKQLQMIAVELDCELEFFQSNHEGAILDFLQQESSRAADGVIINPGALMHYGYSLRQALVDLGKPTIEVHMSDIHKTEIKTGVNVLEDIRIDQIVGMKEHSLIGMPKAFPHCCLFHETLFCELKCVCLFFHTHERVFFIPDFATALGSLPLLPQTRNTFHPPLERRGLSHDLRGNINTLA